VTHASLAKRNATRHIPAGGMPRRLKAALIAEILTSYAVARWRMSRGDIRDVVQAARGRLATAGQPLAGADQELVAARLGYAVTKTLRVLPTDSRCLVQALVLSELLSTRGIPSTIVIGAHSQPAFEAHAWVEYAGRPALSPEGFGDSRLVEL
jgi:Transglutaminase-like superfamily